MNSLDPPLFLCCNFGQTVIMVILISLCCRRTKDRKEEVAEPEADPERDQRTVFAYQVYTDPFDVEVKLHNYCFFFFFNCSPFSYDG